MINGVCKIGETRAAIELLRMIDGGLTEPDVVMYNTIIDGLRKHKLVLRLAIYFLKCLSREFPLMLSLIILSFMASAKKER